ncbi:DUF11 domain-containing protein [Caulobacter sp. RHG1]|uniref:DUF11 domain-containing protein n=1 Tax=Caulobacter sp. (strain RHG1) TaxID=2545762 RepID=UPI00155653BC|nr:DUF11 domain-containing protein [Caulobacter sp. RHG1]NQE61238.1 hypothetical protein [Caulobacter sp. RHG1]
MKKSSKKLWLAGASALLVVMSGQAALAAPGTQAGTSVTNTATVSYSVNSVAQTPVASNVASFVVDRKADVVVAEVGGTATTVAYGQTNQVTTFTVTNATNAIQDIRLFAANTALGAPTQLGHTDTYGVTNLRVFVDSNGNGTYDAGVDLATYIDELGAGQTKTVFIVADIPASGPANGVSGVFLTAVVAAGGQSGSLGADLTQSLLDDPNQIDTVFADGAGYADLIRDARHSAGDEYLIAASSAEVTKFAVVISDPLNGIVTPKAIPGAVVEYCIAVKNIGAQAITGVGLTDNIPANTTYVANSTYVNGTFSGGLCVLDGSQASDASAFNGTRVATTIASIASGATATTRFRVTIN